MNIHVITADAVSENVHLTLLKIIQMAIVFTLADAGARRLHRGVIWKKYLQIKKKCYLL